MAYLKISAYKRKTSDLGDKYLIESDIDIDVDVFETHPSGTFIIVREDVEIMKVNTVGYFRYLGKELINKVNFGFDKSFEGYPKGLIDVKREFNLNGWSVDLNQSLVAKISYSEGNLLSWLFNMCTQFKYFPYEDWVCIDFDKNKMDVDIALGILTLIFSRDLN